MNHWFYYKLEIGVIIKICNRKFRIFTSIISFFCKNTEGSPFSVVKKGTNQILILCPKHLPKIYKS
jgi:hypothetical protein